MSQENDYREASKLERNLRLVPILCVLGIIIMRRSVSKEDVVMQLIGTIVFTIVAIISYSYVIYLEKKDGRFNPKKYYVLCFFIFISTCVFLFNYFRV